MKKILVLSVLFLVIPALVLAGSTVKLPDFEKEAKVTYKGACDNEKTKITVFEHKDYTALVMVIESGYSFFDVMNRDLSLGGYYMKSPNSSEVVKMSHQEWDKKLESIGKNYYNNLHYTIETDCKIERIK